MQGLDRPAALDEPGRRVVEEFGVGRRLAAGAEVVGGPDQCPADVRRPARAGWTWRRRETCQLPSTREPDQTLTRRPPSLGKPSEGFPACDGSTGDGH